MLKPWEVIKELEADNSRLAKEAIIRRESAAGNDELFLGFRKAYDAMVTFGVKQVAEKSGNGKGITPAAFWRIADQLSSRQLTGNAAVNAVNYLRMNATEEEWNFWYRRILIKDMRCGTSETTVNKHADPQYHVTVFSCQLAHDGANHENKVTGEKLIEVKLDGVRVITIVYPSGQVDQYSRNGKELVNFPHIRQQLARHAMFFKTPTVLDGEVMSSSFQDLMKQVHRKTDVTSDDAVLNLFDILSLDEFRAGRGEYTQIDRSAVLRNWHQHLAEHMPNVTVVGQELVDLDTEAGAARFDQINADAVAGGYEGLLIKDPEAPYECKRSVAWLKKKPVISVDLKVVELEEGTGKNAGILGALVCEGIDQDKFIRVNVGSGLTDKQRQEMWQDKQAVIGQTVEILADVITKSQDSDVYSLRFPRFMRFREDK